MLALIQDHAIRISTNTQRAGLKFLFHGGPGTGKTLTAESLAEHIERPLYTVTCGDMGTDLASVNTHLDGVLDVIKIWESVVVLSDVDVFLEHRQHADVHRSVIVSALFRILDYHGGIVIFTTTRHVSTFDEAVRSRMRLTINFPDLGEWERKQIWAHSILALEEAGVKMNIHDLVHRADEFAKVRLNG